MIIQKKIFVFLFFIYLSLLIGFYFGEDVIGGAFNDYKSLSHVAFKFKDNFLLTLINYDDLGHRHSPIFFIIKNICFLKRSHFLQRKRRLRQAGPQLKKF